MALEMDCIAEIFFMNQAWTRREWIVLWLPPVLLLGLALTLNYTLPQFKRHFSLTDPEIAFPFAEKETVPSWALFLLSVALPVVAISAATALKRKGWWFWHNRMLEFVTVIAFTMFITDVVKVIVGRPRPDLISRCNPSPSAIGNTTTTAGVTLYSSDICTVETDTDKKRIKDGFKAFPSGHSSYTFAGMTFMGLVLEHLFTNPFHVLNLAYWMLVPWSIATLVAVSRVDDYRHHWQDVVAGSLLGITMAYVFFKSSVRKPQNKADVVSNELSTM
jgi:diacylglycerol diphosphate phosphatase/phosphatidate phosphatase